MTPGLELELGAMRVPELDGERSASELSALYSSVVPA